MRTSNVYAVNSSNAPAQGKGNMTDLNSQSNIGKTILDNALIIEPTSIAESSSMASLPISTTLKKQRKNLMVNNQKAQKTIIEPFVHLKWYDVI